MKILGAWALWLLFVLGAAYLLVLHVTPPSPKPPTLTQYQLLENRVKVLERGQKRLEKVVGLVGEDARKEGLQNVR
jgi:hypothetical protein